MKHIPIVFALLVFLMLAPQNARAEYNIKQGLIPEKYYGQWAAPNCEKPTSVITIYGHLILDASESANFTLRSINTVMNDDIFIAHIANIDFLMTGLTDNSLNIARVYNDNEHDALLSLAELSAEHGRKYVRCAELNADFNWASLNPTAIKAVPALHQLEKTCDGQFIEDSPHCQQETFGFFDEDHDGLLNRTELERAYLLATFFGGSTDCYFPHHFTDIVKSDSTSFADDTIRSMDTNKDFKLSLNEIITNWERAALQRSFTRFMEYTNDLAILLYFIPHYPYIER